jgi:hypothetical protein
MTIRTQNLIGFGAILVASHALGCDQVADAADQCGLECDLTLIGNGNGAITGIASFDSFFGAAANINSKAKLIASAVGEAQAKMAVLLGLGPTAGVAEIQAAWDAKVMANAGGSIQVNFKPPKCQASVDATVEATAKCDATVTPGTAMVSCSGKCEGSASASATCSGGAKISCKGTAPELNCNGTCNGECEGSVTAEGNCTASCSGTCNGSCTVRMDGSTMCNGTCEG